MGWGLGLSFSRFLVGGRTAQGLCFIIRGKCIVYWRLCKPEIILAPPPPVKVERFIVLIWNPYLLLLVVSIRFDPDACFVVSNEVLPFRSCPELPAHKGLGSW